MACAVVHLRRERDDEKRTARNNYCSSMRDRGEGGEEGRSFLVDGWAKGAKEQKREREREIFPRKGNSRARNGRGKDQRGAFPSKVVKNARRWESWEEGSLVGL